MPKATEVFMVNVDEDCGVGFFGVRNWNLDESGAQSSVWNGRDVTYKDRLLDLSLRDKFYYAADADQSFSYEAHGETSNGDSAAGASATYEISTETDRGTTYSGSITTYGEIDNHGNTSGGVKAEGKINF